MRTGIMSLEFNALLPEPGKQHGTHNKHVKYTQPPPQLLTEDAQVPIGVCVIKLGFKQLFFFFFKFTCQRLPTLFYKELKNNFDFASHTISVMTT